MNRTLRSVSASALLLVLTACTPGMQTGATLPPLTTDSDTSAAATTSDATRSTDAPTSAAGPSSATGEPSPATGEPPADVTVPAEASALPLPTEQVEVPADNEQEVADRAAIEAVWREVWELARRGYDIPADEVRATADRLMTDPVRSQFVEGLSSGDERGVTSYGQIVLHPYWYTPIGDLTYAVMGDCADFSLYGEADRATGEKKTVGTKNANRVGQFVKSEDGTWRLWNFTRVPDVACTAP